MERIERQQLLNRKRKRTRQLHFDSARSTTETGTESASSSCDAEEFSFIATENVFMEEEETKQVEDSAYRIDLQVMTPESLVDFESELSDSELSLDDSDSDTEHEEDGYQTTEFFEEDPDSDSESEDQMAKLNSILSNGTEVVRHRFPYLSMRVFLSDFMCLLDDSFVNDTIMDFCLNDLVFNRIPEDLYKVHSLPSTFWYYLQVLLFEDAGYKEDSLTDKLMRRYSRLEGFIEHVDLFDQDFLVLPLNDQNHWSLCVVCCPNVLSDLKPVEQSNVIDPNPCIVMFDSQPSNRTTLEKYGVQVREFLQFAYLYQNGYSEDLADRFSDQKCPVVVPDRMPRQTNPYDCGVYALEFASNFFKNPPSMRKISEGKFEFLTEYPSFSISSKRNSLKEEILSMSNDRRHFECILGYRTD